jgi:hypothetical protein
MFTHENEQRETYTTFNGDEWQLATWTDEDTGEWTGCIMFPDTDTETDNLTADTREELLNDLRFWAADFDDDASDNPALDVVMTPAEIEQRFGLASGTVRQAVNRDPKGVGEWYRRPDGRTILVSAEYAFGRWHSKDTWCWDGPGWYAPIDRGTRGIGVYRVNWEWKNAWPDDETQFTVWDAARKQGLGTPAYYESMPE